MSKPQMKNGAKKNKAKKTALRPLLNAIRAAFTARQTSSPRPAEKKAEPARAKPKSIKFESLEPRVLMSADVNPAQTITGSIDVAGEVDQYGFNLAQDSRIIFDSLTNTANMNWTLTGPQGMQVSSRNFNASDSADATSSPLLNLAAGDYTLTVDAINDVTGGYGFRLIDVNKTQEIVSGQVVTGQLLDSKETNAYRFSAVSGERFFFDQLSLSGGNTYWRLFDPNGNAVFGPTAMADVSTTTLLADGSYTLLVEGRITSTGTSNYSFSIQKFADATAALTLDTTVSGTIAFIGQRNIQTFTLDSRKELYFDSLTNNANISWTLVGPQGAVATRTFAGSDSSSLGGSAVYDAVAGNYQLIISSTNGTMPAFSFRLRDVGAAAVLTPSTTTSGTLTAATESKLYRISATAGERYYFDYISSSGAVPTWRLLDPFGNLIFGPTNINADAGLLTFASTGDYLLMVEGAIASTGSTTYNFNVQKVTDDTAVLPLNTTITGNIAHPGQRDFYTFTLGSSKRMYFDALTNNASLIWSLSGPQGTVVSNQGFGGFLYDLAAGDYILTIDLPAEQVGGYSFRFVDLAQAVALTPGTSVSSQLNPANETDLYKFDVNAGDKFLFDFLSSSGTAPVWRLLDPWGNEVFGQTTMNVDQGPLVLNYAGTYTLLIEGLVASISRV
jgi:hypothetical protein